MNQKDLLIIGGGPAGIIAAMRGAEKGLDVALAEKEELGGVCLNKGCIPSKSLATASDIAYQSENGSEIGIKADVEVDYGKVVDWSDKNTKKVVKNCSRMLKSNNVEIKKSEASFLSSNEAEIGNEKIEFEKALIATGSSPTELPHIPVNHKKIIDSDDFFSLKELPEELLILGAGYIGMEIGTICSKLGSEVTVIEMMDQVLPHFEKRMVKPITRKAKKIGLDINLSLEVTEVDSGEGVTLKAETKESEVKEFKGDKCLVSVGRTPTTKGLNLENTEVTLDDKGFIETEDNFLTEDQNIYACGDVAGGKMLAHEAYHDSVVALDHIIGDKSSKGARVPEVVFTDPQLARIGDFDEDYNIGRTSFRAVGAAYTKNKPEGMIQLAVNKKGILKGGRIVGPYASEIIHEVALAIENKLSAEDIADTIHAHPTISEGVARAAEDALDLAPCGC